MYRILLASKAERELKSLPSEIITRIDLKIRQLATEPRPPQSAKLISKEKPGWRIRVGDYRILYQIDDEKKSVIIYRIKHRREVYR